MSLNLFFSNLIMLVVSVVILLAGFYFVKGLCCRGNLLSRATGVFFGLTGVAGFLLTFVPIC